MTIISSSSRHRIQMDMLFVIWNYTAWCWGFLRPPHISELWTTAAAVGQRSKMMIPTEAALITQYDSIPLTHCPIQCRCRWMCGQLRVVQSECGAMGRGYTLKGRIRAALFRTTWKFAFQSVHGNFGGPSDYVFMHIMATRHVIRISRHHTWQYNVTAGRGFRGFWVHSLLALSSCKVCSTPTPGQQLSHEHTRPFSVVTNPPQDTMW